MYVLVGMLCVEGLMLYVVVIDLLVDVFVLVDGCVIVVVWFVGVMVIVVNYD